MIQSAEYRQWFERVNPVCDNWEMVGTDRKLCLCSLMKSLIDWALADTVKIEFIVGRLVSWDCDRGQHLIIEVRGKLLIVYLKLEAKSRQEEMQVSCTTPFSPLWFINLCSFATAGNEPLPFYISPAKAGPATILIKLFLVGCYPQLSICFAKPGNKVSILPKLSQM